MQAHDDEGNEIFQVMINTICPIEHAAEARQIAYIHMTTVENAVSDSVDQMLTTILGPVDSPEITHIFCARLGYTNQVKMEIATAKRLREEQNLNWCGDKEYTTADSAEEIRSKFCCVTGDTTEVLSHLNLSYK